MSLQVWLPLNGNLQNKGLNGDLVPSGTAYTVNSAGKTGSCITTTSSGYIDLKYDGNQINSGSISFGGWFKFNKANINTILSTKTYTSSARAATGNLMGRNSYGGISIQWESNDIYIDGTFQSLKVCGYIRSESSGADATPKATIPFDTWTHIFFVFDKNLNKGILYINGQFFSSIQKNVIFDDITSASMCLNMDGIAGGNGPKSFIPFDCNDVRIYDHALSLKEIKEISKGLVLHYPLDNNGMGLVNPNLIKNSLTEKTLTARNTGAAGDNYNYYTIFSTGLTIGQTYTFSAIVELEGTQNLKCTVYNYNSSETSTGRPVTNTFPADGITRGEWTFTAVNTGLIIYAGVAGATRGVASTFKKMKLEQGSIATPWCPNTQDDQYTILGYDDTTVQDVSGYQNNGTASTGITYNTDSPRYNVSTHGIGTQDKIIAPGLPQSVQTVSFWAKRDNTTDCVFFADGSAKIAFGILRNQGVTGISSQKLFSLTNWDNSKWNHIVVINNNGIRNQLWINGIQEGDGSENNYWTHTASQLWFFTRNYNNNYPLTGSISDFRAYVTALSQQDILQLYQTSTLVDKNDNFYTYEYDEQGYNNELQYMYDLQKSSSYTGTFFQNSDGLHIDGQAWVYHDYIPINPTNKTFKYDITYSNSSGNKLYIGWERYDANKTSRSNNATIYVISGVTSTASYQRVRGTVDLSTDGVNPTAFIKLRILNKWTGSAEGTEGTAIIHSLSLKEWTSNQNFDIININKQGVAYETQILEKHKENVNANRSQELISNNFYEI